MDEPTTAPAKDPAHGLEDDTVNAIVSRGPAGAFAVAGIATAIVIALYVAFYLFAYLPRGVIQ